MGSQHDGQPVTPVEQHLRLYNQYPGSYVSFQQMMEDLPRIAAMGFKQVWVNPFYETCKENKLMSHKIDCPYAMRDHTKLNPEYGASFEDVKEYTKEARRLDLVPIFDLVANHVAIDHPFVDGDKELFNKGIDTKKWFQRHSNGNLRIKGYDENLHKLPISRNPWTDVAQFDYKNEEIRNQIFKYFWKPFIDQNVDLGFMGARIDAPGRIPHEVHELLLNYLKQKCREKYNAEPYIVAETVGSGNPEADRDAVMGVATHTMNSAFWMPGPEGSHGGNDLPYSIWSDDNGEWVNKNKETINEGRKNWYAPLKGILQTVAPTAGHSGSHDEDRYPHILKEKWGINDRIMLKQRMLEMIMVAAFGSDGGHILAYGDEFGVEERINLHKRKVIDLSTQQQYDLTYDIKQVNDIVKKLPPPTKPEWTQRVFYPKYPELVIFIVHEGEGFNCNSHLIIGNSYNEEDKHITLDNQMLEDILHANGRNPDIQMPNKIFLCGKITASGVTPEVIHSEPPPSTLSLKASGIISRTVR
jgi:starch synthase (maltosyl-transferring)